MFAFSKTRNRVISVLISILVFVLSICLPMYRVSAATNVNTIMYYNIYDVAEGYYDGYYSLSTVSTISTTSTRSVYDDDTRVVDFTKSGVVKLVSGTSYVGTGFIVDAHTIATSAHCVYNKNTSDNYSGNTVTSILVFNSNGAVVKTVTNLKQIHVPRLYIATNTGSGEANPYDYALITVEEDLSDYAIFNLGVMMDNFPNTRSAVSVTGFPLTVNGSTVNSHSTHRMYTGTGTLLASDDYCCYYNTDTSGGNSGGPLYVTTTFNNKTYYTVIGIHGYGNVTCNGSSMRYNAAIRMTTNLLQFYKNNPNL